MIQNGKMRGGSHAFIRFCSKPKPPMWCFIPQRTKRDQTMKTTSALVIGVTTNSVPIFLFKRPPAPTTPGQRAQRLKSTLQPRPSAPPPLAPRQSAASIVRQWAHGSLNWNPGRNLLGRDVISSGVLRHCVDERYIDRLPSSHPLVWGTIRAKTVSLIPASQNIVPILMTNERTPVERIPKHWLARYVACLIWLTNVLPKSRTHTCAWSSLSYKIGARLD